MQDSIDEYPYSTYMYLIERLNEIENLCVYLQSLPACKRVPLTIVPMDPDA